MEMENIRVMLVRTHVSTRCPMLHVTRYPRRSPRARVRAAACWRCCRRTPPPPRARAWPAQPARGPGARCTGRTAQSRRQPEASRICIYRAGNQPHSWLLWLEIILTSTSIRWSSANLTHAALASWSVTSSEMMRSGCGGRGLHVCRYDGMKLSEWVHVHNQN